MRGLRLLCSRATVQAFMLVALLGCGNVFLDSESANITGVPTPNPTNLSGTSGSTVVLSPNQTLVGGKCDNISLPFGTAPGGSVGVLTGGRTLDLAVNGNGDPVVAWIGPNGAHPAIPQVYVQTWRDGAWAGYGASNNVSVDDGISAASNNFGKVSDLALAIDPQGDPGVIWQNFDGAQGRIYYQQWSGSTWTPIGGTSAVDACAAYNSSISQVGVAFAKPGTPVLAYDPLINRGLALLVGGAQGWNTAMLPGSDKATLSNLSLAAAPGYDPAVLYNSNGGLFGARFSLSTYAWGPLGPSLASSVVNRVDRVGQAVAIDSANRVVVAWQDSSRTGVPDIYLLRWTGTTWEDLGGSNTDGGVSRSTRGATQLSLTIDTQDNPALAWQDAALQQIFVRHWNGKLWETLGTGSGVSDSSGYTSYASEPRVRFAQNGTMLLAWKLNGDFATVCEFVP